MSLTPTILSQETGKKKPEKKPEKKKTEKKAEKKKKKPVASSKKSKQAKDPVPLSTFSADQRCRVWHTDQFYEGRVVGDSMQYKDDKCEKGLTLAKPDYVAVHCDVDPDDVRLHLPKDQIYCLEKGAKKVESEEGLARKVMREASREPGSKNKRKFKELMIENELRNDKEFVLKAVKQDGWTLYHASKELKNDKEFVLEAVKQNGWALYYASKELRNDKEVVLEAVKQNGQAFKYASEELINVILKSG